jgi:hypothetical protein
MADICNLSPILKLSFKLTECSRADAFGAAILRSTFRKRQRTSVFRRWFNWMSWKKQGLSSCIHRDVIPLVVAESEFRTAQVLKNIVAWFFISWSNYFSKKRKQKQLQHVITAISRLHKLRSSIFVLHRMADFMKNRDVLLSKISSARRRCSISRSFQGLYTTLRAATLGRLHNSRLQIARLFHWKKLCQMNSARWNRYYTRSLCIRYLREWRSLISILRLMIGLRSRVILRFQATSLLENFFAWMFSHFKRLQTIKMRRKSILTPSFQNWLLESVILRHQRIVDIEMQTIFEQKRAKLAICNLASFVRKSHSAYHLIVSKQLRQKCVGTKSTCFRAWASHAFKKRNVGYQNLIKKRTKKAVMRIVRDVLIRWWLRMKQVSRVRILKQRRTFNDKKMATSSWRITTVTSVSHRSNNMDAIVRRRNRRLIASMLPAWRIQTRNEARTQQLLLRFDADFFKLSRIFRVFLSNCQKQCAEFRSLYHHSVLKLHVHAWFQKSQQSSTVECAQRLLEKMRIIRQYHTAVTHLKRNVTGRQATMSVKFTTHTNFIASSLQNRAQVCKFAWNSISFMCMIHVCTLLINSCFSCRESQRFLNQLI